MYNIHKPFTFECMSIKINYKNILELIFDTSGAFKTLIAFQEIARKYILMIGEYTILKLCQTVKN